MKALTLQQPWASLIAVGAKRVETRGWRPKEQPAVIVIASSKKPMSKRWRAICDQEPFATALQHHGLDPDGLPRASYLATVRLTSCRRTTEIIDRLGHEERAFGDYSPGRWAWLLSSPQRLEPAIAIPADPPDRKVFRLNLWQIPDDQFVGPLLSAAIAAGRQR